MSEINKSPKTEADEVDHLEGELNEMAGRGGPDVTYSVNGSIHISEEVIMELAKKTLTTIPGVMPASPGIASKLGIGRKASDGIRVSVEDKVPPLVTVDVYILVKYGLRIPDAAWDVQEAIKNSLEQYTGYDVNAVNINVQGIYFHDKPAPVPEAEAEDDKHGSPHIPEPSAPPFVDEDDDVASDPVVEEKPDSPEVDEEL